MKKKPTRIIQDVLDQVYKEISEHSKDHEGIYGKGTASEGYNGGYAQALSDVLLILNGVVPTHNRWWRRSLQKDNS